MEAINSDVIERRRPIRRNDSMSTIASSAAAAQVQHIENMQQVQQFTTLNNNDNQIFPTNNQTSLKFENSEGVHVGNIINHYYQTVPPIVLNNKEARKSSQSNSSLTESFKIAKKCFISNNRRRNVLIIAITISTVVLISIIIPIIYFTLTDNDKNNNPDDNTTTITTSTTSASEVPSDLLITREEWNADSPKDGIKKLIGPIKRIIVAHTGGNSCNTMDECKTLVKKIQTENSDLDDIPYNFLIGNDGKVYEGRGFEFQGQHTSNLYGTEFNSIGICIAFIGNYNTTSLTEDQLRIFTDFINHYISKDVSEDYLIFSQDDLMNTDIKSSALNEAFSNFENFLPLHPIFKRKDWSTEQRTNEKKFDEAKDWVVLTHTDTESCGDLIECANIAKELQINAIQNGSIDIPYNFLIGDNEIIFEGRGWDVQSEFSKDCCIQLQFRLLSSVIIM
ncbi:hypothetical protein PVAND_006531 [Polypedilum vanderplanki]|uniref:Peptidoglycan recognition protein family domain-containing protein n=1 Tax=Polypedilum vanderplanki TaxID=319348 RepID=A0A9J6C3Y0_POLVA|nr:hypothetical protein PVAND_006531 [Polypedilum vanderplanki]